MISQRPGASLPYPRQHASFAAVNILGVYVHTLSMTALLDFMVQTAQAGRQGLVTYVHAHALNCAYESPPLRACLNQANVNFCDGFGVLLAARLLGQHMRYRYTPPDWIEALCERCVQQNLTLFFLGARPGVVQQAAEVLQARFPSLQIVGMAHGYFDKTLGSAESEAVIAQINAVQPHMLIVGFGMPLQEYWLIENRARLQANVLLTVGAMFDYVAGDVARGPRWMTNHGLEWLSRLLVEPTRLWRRYLLGNPLFVWRVLRQRYGLLRVS